MQKELAYQQYRRTQIQTSDPGDLLLMLYQGAIRFSKLALEGINDKQVEKAHNNIVKVQDIISELVICLNFDAGEIAKNLNMLYEYMNDRLVQANISKDPEPLEEVLQMLTELHNTWTEVVRQQKGKANSYA